MIVKTATATAAATATLSVEEYIALEEAQLERRFEYIDGELFEMPGGTINHSRLKLNVFRSLDPQLIGKGCEILNTDVRVSIGASRYVYPDLSVVCGQLQARNNDTTLLNPIMMIEVTSPSSALYDRVDKRDFYTAVPSMQAYLVIDQASVYVELYMRDGQRWRRDIYDSLDDVIEIKALGCRLPLTAIYRNIAFTSA